MQRLRSTSAHLWAPEKARVWDPRECRGYVALKPTFNISDLSYAFLYVISTCTQKLISKIKGNCDAVVSCE